MTRTKVKWDKLHAALQSYGSVLVAFSGGADSALVLAAAVRALGADQVGAAIGHSAALPRSERGPALEFAQAQSVRVFTPETTEMSSAGYAANAGDRCAFCKTALLESLTAIADDHGFQVVATGTNADDVVAGFRPGIAAAAGLGAVTPLATAGFTKAMVRELSREWALPTWDKPAAACLSSRIAYGIEITPARLARVERAERSLREWLETQGYRVRDLRVRDLGDQARVEVNADLVGVTEQLINENLRAVPEASGWPRVTVAEFRSGSMNELLNDPERYR